MNNKGQVLVLFIIILPILLLGLIVSIDLINLTVLKQTTDNEIREIIYNGIKNNKTLEEINILIDKNIEYEKKSVFRTDENIKINITQNKSIFGKNIELKYNYEGILNNEKIIIREG